MKDLYSIYEKLDINNVKITKFANNFPIDEDIEVIIDFLKVNNFVEIPYKKGDYCFSIYKKFNKNKGKKVFEYSPSIEILRFADMSKDINEENPIFLMDKLKFFYIEPELDSLDTYRLNKEEFLKAINKVFGWK